MAELASASYLYRVKVEPASPDAFGTDTKAHALGTRLVVPASRQDRTLFWIDTNGAIAGGPTWGTATAKASTDVEVKHEANSGSMEWVYVKNVNGSTIERGQTVTADAGATPFEVKEAGAGDRIIGVAQFDIPDDACAWILAKGVGYGLLAGDASDLALLQAAANGELNDTSATTSNAIAQVLAANSTGGAAIRKIRLFGGIE